MSSIACGSIFFYIKFVKECRATKGRLQVVAHGEKRYIIETVRGIIVLENLVLYDLSMARSRRAYDDSEVPELVSKTP